MKVSQKLLDAISAAENTSLRAVSHVGSANYASREAEAARWVRGAFNTVMITLQKQDAEESDQDPSGWRAAVARGDTLQSFTEWTQALKPAWQSDIATGATELGFTVWLVECKTEKEQS